MFTHISNLITSITYQIRKIYKLNIGLSCLKYLIISTRLECGLRTRKWKQNKRPQRRNSISSFIDVGSRARSVQPHEVENFWLWWGLQHRLRTLENHDSVTCGQSVIRIPLWTGAYKRKVYRQGERVSKCMSTWA